MRIGAQELPDVESLLKKIKVVIIIFTSLTAILFLVGWIRHDYSALCIPYSYPPIIQMAKGINAAWTTFSITLYCVTVKGKNAETKEAHEMEPEETKACRKVYE